MTFFIAFIVMGVGICRDHQAILRLSGYEYIKSSQTAHLVGKLMGCWCFSMISLDHAVTPPSNQDVCIFVSVGVNGAAYPAIDTRPAGVVCIKNRFRNAEGRIFITSLMLNDAPASGRVDFCDSSFQNMIISLSEP